MMGVKDNFFFAYLVIFLVLKSNKLIKVLGLQKKLGSSSVLMTVVDELLSCEAIDLGIGSGNSSLVVVVVDSFFRGESLLYKLVPVFLCKYHITLPLEVKRSTLVIIAICNI